MKKTDVIVLAAGKGTRLKSKTPKAFIKLGPKPLVYYSLRTFQNNPGITNIILVVPKNKQKVALRLIKNNKFKKVSAVIPGGKERINSVNNGTKHISKQSSYLLVHDSARPFTTDLLINKILRQLKNNRAVIPGIPVKDTVKYSDSNNCVRKTIKREKLYQIQTPQGFRTDLFLKKIKNRKLGRSIYDDSFLVESNYKVKIIDGESINFKITTKEDLRIATKLIK